MPFDVSAVVRDLQRRRHPNAVFVESIVTGGRSAGGGLGAAG